MLAKLAAEAADVWVASASGSDAGPYLVPLSVEWVDERIVLALDAGSQQECQRERQRRAVAAWRGGVAEAQPGFAGSELTACEAG